MRAVRSILAAAAVAASLALTGCAASESTPTVSIPPAAAAPTALPSGWTESAVRIGDATGVYTAPTTANRLKAALIVTGTGAPESVGPDLATVLAGSGVASLRLTSARGDYPAALATGRAALTDLAGRPGVGRDRLLVVGQGDGAALGLDLTAGTEPPVRGLALLEPVFGVDGAPAPARLIAAVPVGKHVLISCSDADPTVQCTDVQHLADAMIGTHVNFVRLGSADRSLREDGKFSPVLNQSFGSWASMQ